MKYSLTAFTAVASLPLALAGINCDGSYQCPKAPMAGYGQHDGMPIVAALSQMIQRLPDDTWLPNGYHIACVRTICAFVQGADHGGLHAWQVKSMSKMIVAHGCNNCGSVPTYYPNVNTGEYGELTMNYVSERCGQVLDHICDEFLAPADRTGNEEPWRVPDPKSVWEKFKSWF